MEEMPELPEPARTEVNPYSERFNGELDAQHWYTAEQMLAYREAVREWAAKVAEEIGIKYQALDGTYQTGKKAGAFESAQAIRGK
jgi:hypothetical protein